MWWLLSRSGGPLGGPVRVHFDQPQHAFAGVRHAPSVRRPHRAVQHPHAHIPVLGGRDPARLAPVERLEEDLVSPLPEARRVLGEDGHGDRRPVRGERRAAGGEEVVADRRDVARGEIHHLHGARQTHDGGEDEPVAGGGEHRRDFAARGGGGPALGARVHVAYPDVERARPVGGVGEPRAVARPRGQHVDEGIVRQSARRRVTGAAGRAGFQVEQPQVAQRGEGDVSTVGGDGRSDDPEHGFRPGLVERTRRPLVVRSRELEGGLEGDVGTPAPVHRRHPDHAVRGVDYLISRHPVGTEGEDIGVVRAEAPRRGVRARLERRHVQSRLPAAHGGVGDVPSIGAPGRGDRARDRGNDLPRAIGSPDDDGSTVPARGVGERVAIVRPLRSELVARGVRHLARDAAAEIQRPDVVVPRPVRGEDDRSAIGGVSRFPFVVRTEGVLHRIGAIGPDRPDVPAAVPERLEDDAAPVRGPLRLPSVVVHVRDRACLAAPGVHHPQRALEVEHHPASVGGDGRGHVRALGHGDANVTILGMRRCGQE